MSSPWSLSSTTVYSRGAFLALMKIIATQHIMQKNDNITIKAQTNSLWGREKPRQAKLKTKLRLFVAEASIKMSWKCLSHPVAFHFVFNLVRQPPAIASSLLFLPDQAKRGCGLNMSSHQRATSNLPPFASMVPINTLLPPRREATGSEGARRGPGVIEIWSAWERIRERRRGERQK